MGSENFYHESKQTDRSFYEDPAVLALGRDEWVPGIWSGCCKAAHAQNWLLGKWGATWMTSTSVGGLYAAAGSAAVLGRNVPGVKPICCRSGYCSRVAVMHGSVARTDTCLAPTAFNQQTIGQADRSCTQAHLHESRRLFCV
eukprot:6200922-Pleurochrysis_carterae.AAC.2